MFFCIYSRKQESNNEKQSNSICAYYDRCRDSGLYLGAALSDNGLGWPILCSMIAGIGCIIYAIDNPKQ